MPLEAARWGLWGVGFLLPMTSRENARKNLESILPQLKPQWAQWKSQFKTGRAMTLKDTLEDRLARYHQIKLTVVGEKSGKNNLNSSLVLAEGARLYLVPVCGSDTQWGQNVLSKFQLRGAEAELSVH